MCTMNEQNISSHDLTNNLKEWIQNVCIIMHCVCAMTPYSELYVLCVCMYMCHSMHLTVTEIYSMSGFSKHY